MPEKKTTCHVCKGIDSEDCQECDGTGNYDFYKYSCAFDDGPEMNELAVEEEKEVENNNN